MRLRRFARLLALLVLAATTGDPAAARTLAQEILAPGYAPIDESGAHEDIVAAVSDSLWNERFDELEQMAKVFRRDKARTPSGIWRLSVFYEGLRLYDERTSMEADSPIHGWLAAYPKSAAAHIGYATMLVEEAWKIRGKGFANTVADENWAPFHKMVERARTELVQSKYLADGDPHWYATMAEIATIQGWEDSEFDALLHEAMASELTYTDTYFEAGNRAMPKWGGGAKKLERLARDVLERTRAIEGSALYTRIYWLAANAGYEDDLFEKSAVDWAEMSKGMDDILARYPSQWNINNFAHFACLAGDYEKALALMKRIQFQPMVELWGGVSSYYACKWWAELTVG
jgi:uncharacterized protein DUF4034